MAYFSLSFKEVTLNPEKVSRTLIRKLDGFSKHATTVKAFLIGQIGKNSLVADNPLCLQDILKEAYNAIAQAQALVGGRIVILECEDTPKLIELYERHGYKILEIAEESSLKTMYTSIIE
ncbi:acetyltransferase [Acinetobacter indicus]|uniref:acetyltransferase n=1 Tax=Acinetobacter indicus TaxID=756892 RepID=UPI001D196F6E|nr:acetyltransferase [Acinetobacter indicus]